MYYISLSNLLRFIVFIYILKIYCNLNCSMILSFAWFSQVGSFQVFVDNYKDASYWLSQFESYEMMMDSVTKKEFQLQFESLVILDYIIRNTGVDLLNLTSLQ